MKKLLLSLSIFSMACAPKSNPVTTVANYQNPRTLTCRDAENNITLQAKVREIQRILTDYMNLGPTFIYNLWEPEGTSRGNNVIQILKKGWVCELNAQPLKDWK